MRGLLIAAATVLLCAPASAQDGHCKSWEAVLEAARYAPSADQAALVTACHAQGTNWGERDKYGFTAMTTSATLDDGTIFETLLNEGVDPDLTDRTGETAAHQLGVSSSLFSITPAESAARIALLAKAGADFERFDSYQMTPIMVAASFGNADVLRALMRHGADPLRLSPTGRNALFATLQGTCEEETGTILLDAGARLDVLPPTFASIARIGLASCNGSDAERAYARRLEGTLEK